jgi:hypothetical protein
MNQKNKMSLLARVECQRLRLVPFILKFFEPAYTVLFITLGFVCIKNSACHRGLLFLPACWLVFRNMSREIGFFTAMAAHHFLLLGGYVVPYLLEDTEMAYVKAGMTGVVMHIM